MPNDKEIQLPPLEKRQIEVVRPQQTQALCRGSLCFMYPTADVDFWMAAKEQDIKEREHQLKEVIAEVDRLKLDLKAMTEDRNLWQDEHNEDCPNLAELAQLKQQSVDLKEALAFIAYGKQHTGVIPCPQDHDFYIKPFRDRAREALDALNIPEDNDETD